MYFYLASPYSSSDPAIREARYTEAVRASAFLFKEGMFNHSSIVHNHFISLHHHLPPDAQFWKEYNQNMIRFSGGMIILMIEGWRDSRGVKMEIEFANMLGIPIQGLNVLQGGGFRLT